MLLTLWGEEGFDYSEIEQGEWHPLFNSILLEGGNTQCATSFLIRKRGREGSGFAEDILTHIASIKREKGGEAALEAFSRY